MNEFTRWSNSPSCRRLHHQVQGSGSGCEFHGSVQHSADAGSGRFIRITDSTVLTSLTLLFKNNDLNYATKERSRRRPSTCMAASLRSRGAGELV
jgi:hypothetical protein